jgi:hypothetical protein
VDQDGESRDQDEKSREHDGKSRGPEGESLDEDVDRMISMLSGVNEVGLN